MAYVYQVSFEIEREQMEQFRIGAALEKVIGYLRTMLPSEPGYITAHAFHSLDNDEKAHVIVLSFWEQWDDIQTHERSELAEKKVLFEFKPHIKLENLTVRIYEEIP